SSPATAECWIALMRCYLRPPCCGTMRLCRSLPGATSEEHGLPRGRYFSSARHHAMKRIAIRVSTGSIGRSTLQIVESYPEQFSVVSLAAGSNTETLLEQARRWRPRLISVATEEAAAEL